MHEAEGAGVRRIKTAPYSSAASNIVKVPTTLVSMKADGRRWSGPHGSRRPKHHDIGGSQQGLENSVGSQMSARVKE